MFVAKYEDKIIQIGSSLDELKSKLSLVIYDLIEETDEDYSLYEGEFLLQDEIETKKRMKLDSLSLTAADVERAIYKVKGMDFEDVVELVKDNPDIDIKALKIELKANNFYRGNPYISLVGSLLGFSEDQLDEFFETGDYTKLEENMNSTKEE